MQWQGRPGDEVAPFASKGTNKQAGKDTPFATAHAPFGLSCEVPHHLDVGVGLVHRDFKRVVESGQAG